MSDLREAIAQTLYEHFTRGRDLRDDAKLFDDPTEFELWCEAADVVLGVVHEHADIEAAGEIVYSIAVHTDDERWPFGPDYYIEAAKSIIAEALGGSEKP